MNEKLEKEKAAARTRAWYRENRKRVLDYKKHYATINCEHIAKYQKEYHDANRLEKKEYDRLYCKANKAKKREQSKAWKLANKDKVTQYSRSRYLRKKDHILAVSKLWKQCNPYKVNAYAGKRRAVLLNATPSWLTKEQYRDIEAVYKEARKISEDKGIQYHVDHIYPLQGKGVLGLHVPWNLQILVGSENLTKINKLPLGRIRT